MIKLDELMNKTEPYCFQSDEQEDISTGVIIPEGWWCSDQAVKDISRPWNHLTRLASGPLSVCRNELLCYMGW